MMQALLIAGCLASSIAICSFLLRVGAKKTVRLEQGDEEFYRQLSVLLKQLPKHVQEDLKQLRGQFEEKSQVLHETRKVLFALEGELFRLQREREEATHEPNEMVLCLEKDIQELVEENAQLKKENSLLEQLITSGKSSKEGEDLMTAFSDEDRVLPLSRGFPVGRTRGPLIGVEHRFSHSSINHRLNREGHSRG